MGMPFEQEGTFFCNCNICVTEKDPLVNGLCRYKMSVSYGIFDQSHSNSLSPGDPCIQYKVGNPLPLTKTTDH
jgi:hypothetical protein